MPTKAKAPPRPKAPPKPRTMTGSEIVLQVLQEEGVEIAFGIPGGQVIPLYVELFRAVEAG